MENVAKIGAPNSKILLGIEMTMLLCFMIPEAKDALGYQIHPTGCILAILY